MYCADASAVVCVKDELFRIAVSWCNFQVKCPNIAYHLTGTKKVQQDLARPGVLERFLSDPVSVYAES